MGSSTKRWMGVAGASAMAAAAFAAAGDLDATFGTGGVVQYAATGNWLADCAVQSDGRIVVASVDGVNTNGSPQRWRIDRRLATGALDTTWGSGGTVTMFSGGDPKNVTFDASGRVLAAGRSTVTVAGKGNQTTSSNMATVARLSSSGAVEFTRSIAVPGASASVATAVAPDASGRILVAGIATLTKKNVTQSGVFVARLTSSGALDTSFGTSGVTVNDVSTVDDSVYAGAIGLQSDGKIVVGGGHMVVMNNVAYRIWDITRYTASGAVDTAFGVVHGPGTYDTDLAGLAVDAYDRIVAVGGRSYAINVSDMLAVRFAANGSLDTGFGDGGATVVHLTNRSQAGNPSIDGSGRITFLGMIFPNAPTSFESELATVRLDAAGDLDSAYGSSGVTAPFVLGARVEPRGLALAPNGDVVVAGDAYDASNVHTWFVERYLGD